MDNFEELNKLLDNLRDNNGKISSSKIINNKETISKINSSKLLFSFPTIKEKIWAIRNKYSNPPICPCGNNLIFNTRNNKYPTYCSRSCPEKIKAGNKTRKETIESKYGVSNISQLESIKSKIKENNLNKYGVDSVFKLDSIKNKIKITNLSKYGYEYHQLNSESKNKINTNKRFNFINGKLKEKLNILKDYYNIVPYSWSKEEFTTVDSLYEFKHLDCNRIFSSTFDDGRLPKCPKCNLISGTSKIERKLQDGLISILGDKVECNNRTIISPYELDIVVDNKLGIEVNGAYWHRGEKGGLSLLDKSNMSPITILHFWDFELENKYNICLSIILSKLNIYDSIIYARKCKIKEVGSEEANNFLNKNHLQGSINSKYRFGLYYNDELVFIITMGNSRFNKKYDYEIHRICSKLNTKVIGGASKIFAYIKNTFNGSIVSYADKRYSVGNIYNKLGFKELDDTHPNYLWIKYNKIITRYKSQKHKLSKILNNFNEDLSESENMINNGFYKIHDCGNKVFLLIL